MWAMREHCAFFLCVRFNLSLFFSHVINVCAFDGKGLGKTYLGYQIDQLFVICETKY